MKRFACGDVVPGCTATFEAKDVDSMLGLVRAHARDDHGIESMDDATAIAVLSNIREA